MSRYVGGPLHGQQVPEEHAGSEEITHTSAYFDEDLLQLSRETHLYTPDAFGNYSHRGLRSS